VKLNCGGPIVVPHFVYLDRPRMRVLVMFEN
jgi:hypothetical protein